ncbi:MAG: transglutaminase-like domain-containing protein [Oscillospiraceae bacterium]|nr:transglutaminase-like domain-containing protein [Oscillospiraceae bacterium]
MENKCKNKLRIITAFILSTIFVIVVCGADSASQARFGVLVTTNDPMRQITFEVSSSDEATPDYADTITANIFFVEQRVTAIDILGLVTSDEIEYRGRRFEEGGGGEFTAVIRGFPHERQSGGYRIRISFEDAASIVYRVYYSEEYGWHFRDNGLAERHMSVVENYTPVPIAVAAQYLVGIGGTNAISAETLDNIQTLGDLIVNELVEESGLGSVSDYDKARAISRWVAANLFYDRDAFGKTADSAESIIGIINLKSVLETSRTICSGYANLTAALLQSQGIKAVTVIGHAHPLSDYEALLTDDRAHEWTAFYYEDEERWVMLDSGWDSLNFFEDNNFTERGVRLKHFDISVEAFAQTHRPVRAEFRDYFAVVTGHEFDDSEYIASNFDNSDNWNNDNISDFDAIPATPANESSFSEESNSVLFSQIVIIGVLTFGVIVCFVVIVVKRRSIGGEK